MDVLTGDPVPGVGVWGLGAAGMGYMGAES